MAAAHAIAGEVWKPVVGYEGYYSVSSLGRIRRDKTWSGTTAGLILKPLIAHNRYPRVYLWKHGIGVNALIHRVVLEAFVGPPPDGITCNHKNGIKTDNRVENLEWVTSSENSLHAFDVLKSRPVGEASVFAKLTEADVREVFRMAVHGGNPRVIGAKFGIGRSQVCRIRDGKSWRHLKLAGN